LLTEGTIYNMESFLNLEGKLILITGASAGIGKQLAIQLNLCGARLALVGSNQERLESLKNELGNARNTYIQFDVTQLEKIPNLIQNVVEMGGPIAGYVNCVGMRSRRPLNLLTSEHVQEIFTSNYFSFLEFVKNICKKKNYQSGLSIVQVSSIASERGAPSVTAYAASKAAVDASIRCLAKELASKEIRLNSVVPAQTNTPIFQELLAASEGKPDPTLQRQFLGLGEPEDVSNLIMFLLSERSRFISGHALPIDGGFLIN